MTTFPIIHQFQVIRPRFETSQKQGFEWLEKAHIESEKKQFKSQEDEKHFTRGISLALKKFACKEEKISKRGHMLADFLHDQWEKMEIFQLHEHQGGLGLSLRSKIFGQFADEIFEEFYFSECRAPSDIIHVSCTGYNCPSAAQKIVSKKNWEVSTTVTHAYHMGCMAAIPAIRMATGFLSACRAKQIDIVHTEMCTLHLNPSLHTPEQLIGQSLFADGFIKYSLSLDENKQGFKVLKVYEEIIPNSIDAMSWECKDWGFYFSLSKEIPQLISSSIKGFISRLLGKTPFDFEKIQKEALFAIHPGGPKILDQIQENLNLLDHQISHSKSILFNCGNMSSATIPHVWEAIFLDERVEKGNLVLGLAFGPGLTICGILMEKQ